MVNNSTNINKTNNHLSPQIIVDNKIPLHITLLIHVLAMVVHCTCVLAMVVHCTCVLAMVVHCTCILAMVVHCTCVLAMAVHCTCMLLFSVQL